MEKAKFLSDFKDQFIDSDIITVEADTDFRQLESWDSLTGMSVIVMIQDLYNIEMSDTDLKKCNTVNDIYEFVASKQ